MGKPLEGGVRGQHKVDVHEITLKLPAPSINFIFCPREIFLMWVGGWVGQPPPPPQGGGH